jgi:hypothetical protein
MPQTSSGPVVRDPVNYYQDIVIQVIHRPRDLVTSINLSLSQVENTLFRAPRGAFRQSEVFSDMFALPVGEGVDVDGSSYERPLRLEGYLAEDFRQFLRVLVPLCVLFLTIVMVQSQLNVLLGSIGSLLSLTISGYPCSN